MRRVVFLVFLSRLVLGKILLLSRLRNQCRPRISHAPILYGVRQRVVIDPSRVKTSRSRTNISPKHVRFCVLLRRRFADRNCGRTFYGIIFRADIRCFALDVPRFFARLSGLRLPERQRCLGRADRHLYGGRVGSVGALAFKNPSDRSVLGRRSFNALRCVRFFSYGVFMKSLTGMSENGIIRLGDGYV